MELNVMDCFGYILSGLAVIEYIIFTPLWLLIFKNVYRNPESSTSKSLVLFNSVIIVVVRAIFLPYILSMSNLIESDSKMVVLYFLSGWWYLNMTIPLVFALIASIKTRIGNICLLLFSRAHKFVVVIPVYNEELRLLIECIKSIVNQNYPKNLIEIHVSFDDDTYSTLYQNTLLELSSEIIDTLNNSVKLNYKGVSIWMHRFKHSGKRGAQGNTFFFIKKNNSELENRNKLILLTDSDNIIADNALNNFSVYFDKNPKKNAYSGYMSCMSKSSLTDIKFINSVQDCEYGIYELNRFFELTLGTVNCLPGAFTAIRYTSLDSLGHEYWFSLESNEFKNITEYHRHALGEDRYLTHLAHRKFPRGSIGICPVARCKTNPPDTVSKFIKQRRRWLLGAISNEMYMICDPTIWQKFPLMLIFKVIQNCLRATSFGQFLVLYSAIVNLIIHPDSMFLYFVSVSVGIGVAWLIAIIISVRLNRYKIAFLWPIMLVFYTIAQVIIDVYTLFTFNKRSWGTRNDATV